MSDHGHDLHSAFPEDSEALQLLKIESPEFRAIASRYHEVARIIHRAEAGLEPVGDVQLEEWKKERLALLDRVAGLVAERRAA
jgi:uncharacterized protein